MRVAAARPRVWPLMGMAAGFVGSLGVWRWPFPHDDVLLQLIHARTAHIYWTLHALYVLLWYSTPLLLLLLAHSLSAIYGRRSTRANRHGALPPYPAPERRDQLYLVLGEHHYDTIPERAPEPHWLVIPERGLYTGVMIVGAVGTGKTSACMHPYIEQLLAYRAHDPDQRLGGLLLEVKGDFCGQVHEILQRYGREDDYVELNLDGPWSYNPLANDLDPYALAYGIASVLTNLYGRSEEPFWMQAYTNLLRFCIALFRLLDGHVTLFDVYCACINPNVIRERLAEGAARFATVGPQLRITASAFLAHLADHTSAWQRTDRADVYEAAHTDDLVEYLDSRNVPYECVTPSAEQMFQAEQFSAVQRWFELDWSRIEPKLRTSIVEGISVFLSLFDDPTVKATFCPPREAASSSRRPLPPIATLIEDGKFLTLNLPVALNPGLARAIGVSLKQDFQRAVLNRIPRMAAHPERHWRPVLFMSDEYQTFATTGENDPSGDEKFFSMSRQGKCIPIVATQSLSSLRSTLAGESWRTLVQALRIKIFLTLSDDYSTRIASELAGRVERLKTSYTLSEAGHRSAVSLLTGRATANSATVSAAKAYRLQFEPTFQPRVFAQLRNAQAIVLGYDGLNPWPPMYCWLKPHFLDVQTSYFDHLAAGRL